MKTVKNLDPDSMFEELKESWRIETKMLMTTKPLSAKEIEFLKARAEEGSPLGQFNYGLYYLLFFYIFTYMIFYYLYYFIFAFCKFSFVSHCSSI